MTLSETGLTAIKGFEGCRLYAYRDTSGIPTIGYGCTHGVRMGMAITYKQAEKMLMAELEKHINHVNKLGVCKTQGQFDALVSFAYNLGNSSLDGSTLLKYIKAGKPTEDIQNQFRRWNHDNGKVLAGLTKRREWEAQRWAQ